jgi:hypothetical protein
MDISSNGAVAGYSFAGAQRPCCAETRQKNIRHPRLNGVQVLVIEASIFKFCDDVRGKRGFPSRQSGSVAEKNAVLEKMVIPACAGMTFLGLGRCVRPNSLNH